MLYCRGVVLFADVCIGAHVKRFSFIMSFLTLRVRAIGAIFFQRFHQCHLKIQVMVLHHALMLIVSELCYLFFIY